MASRYLVLGGFEPSGHDAKAEALIEAATDLGCHVEYLRWRDVVPLADHPIFNSHRFAAARGCPEFSFLLDEPWIVEALAKDLAHLVCTDFDGYVSVHPWSSYICAQALLQGGNTFSPLIDYCGEFGNFPLVVHPRINAYLGAGTVRPLSPAVRSRCHPIGVTARSRFCRTQTCNTDRRDALVVAAGADGWATSSLLPATRILIEKLNPKEVLLLAPSPESKSVWQHASDISGTIISGLSDISGTLSHSRWYLSKGGGTAVAEGLAAGCSGFVAMSGIFWEDDAAMALTLRGIASAVTSDGIVSLPNGAAAKLERERTITAATSVWQFLRRGQFLRPLSEERGIVDAVINNVENANGMHLRATTEELRRRLVEVRMELASEL